jgi:hypothetical protein
MRLSALIKPMQALSSTVANREPSWCALPTEVKHLLMAVAQTWEDTTQSGQYIQQALGAAAGNLDVLVAAYRYFFYKHNDVAALQVANQVLENITQLEGLPTEWTQLAPILQCRREEPIIRLYQNAYAASGLVRSRLGEVERAKEITAQVSELDDRREFGAKTIFEVLTQPPDPDEE